MAALFCLHDKPRGEKLAEMPAGRLRGDAGGESEFGRGQSAAAEQRAQHIGAGWIPNQGGDFGDLRRIRHEATMSVSTPHYHHRYFVRGRSKSGGRPRRARRESKITTPDRR